MFQTLDDLIVRVGTRRVIADNGCWEFRGGHEHKGYPSLYIERRRPGLGVYKKLHRLACALANGLDYDGDWDSLHSCNNTGCWNPAHLRPGTDDDNKRDAGMTMVKDHAETVLKLRAAGWTLKAIGREIGVQHPAVSKFLRAHGGV